MLASEPVRSGRLVSRWGSGVFQRWDGNEKNLAIKTPRKQAGDGGQKAKSVSLRL